MHAIVVKSVWVLSRAENQFDKSAYISLFLQQTLNLSSVFVMMLTLENADKRKYHIRKVFSISFDAPQSTWAYSIYANVQLQQNLSNSENIVAFNS